ncbi:hypothetical protein [Spirillospora sp. NPDC029432]|uniref:hypothetical protein n=1 Tax=Spirillospora sp. NPDC029432 TaxID=3154599 RepID=UPI003452ACAE
MTTSHTPARALFADGARLLRVALRLDAAVTGVNGLAYLALAGPLHDLLGLEAAPSRALGAFLLLYAAAVWAVSLRPRPLAVTAVVEANVVWTVLSLATAAMGWLSLNAVGVTWAVLQAAVVAGFAALQYTALRRTR